MNLYTSRFKVDFQDTPFLATSQTGSVANRLNWRAEMIVAHEQGLCQGKRVLDLGCHDGRFGYACLKNGASHVTGVEGRSHLVEAAKSNLQGAGDFKIVEDDYMNYIRQVQPGDFDLILCLGVFYHTIHQIELLREIHRIRPGHMLLDTLVAHMKAVPDRDKSTLSRFTSQQRGVTEENPLVLCFFREHFELEGNTIDRHQLVAMPTRELVDEMLSVTGFSSKCIDWHELGIQDWEGIEDYKNNERVTYICSPVDSA